MDKGRIASLGWKYNGNANTTLYFGAICKYSYRMLYVRKFDRYVFFWYKFSSNQLHVTEPQIHYLFIYLYITAKQALNHVNVVENALAKGFTCIPLAQSKCVKDKEHALNPNSSIRQNLKNEVHKTTSIEIIYQVGVQNTRSNMLLELFIQLINEPCFNTLRTQEQLGYIVFR